MRGIGSASRRLLLVDDPLEAARDQLRGGLLLTPNERAAAALRGQATPHESLASLAEKRLRDAGTSLASEVAQLSATRQALSETALLSAGAASVTALGAAISELLRAGLGHDPEVEAQLRGSPELAARTKALVRLALHYRALLARAGAVDPAEALWAAALLEERRVPVLVAGYPRVGLAELVFLDSVAADGSVFVLPAGFASSVQAAGELGARGWLVEGASGSAGEGPRPTSSLNPGVALEALRLPNQEDEVRWALAEVKRLLDAGTAQRDITLIARDEQRYGPLVDAVAHEFAVPLRLMYSVPLRSTRLGELLAGLSAALADDLPFEATARLLNHPLLRLLDAQAWAAARSNHPKGAAAWQELAPRTAMLAWPANASLHQYRERLQQLLDESGASGRLSEREGRAKAKLEAALGEYDQRAPMSLANFLATLEELLAVLTISVDPPAKRGVEFHTPLAVFGASYQHVFVLGAAEGVLPAPLGNDPLLDFLERDLVRACGLPLEDAMEAAEREHLSFHAAARTARGNLTLSYPELLDNREQIPSPYFADLGAPTPARPRPRPAASELERLLVGLREHDGPSRRAWLVESRRESDAPPDRFDGVIGDPVDIAASRFSASQLASLGQCAFRWFAQRRLRLAEPEEAEEEVSPTLLGSIYHKTLELAARHALSTVAAAGSAGDAEASAGAGWDEATADAFREAAIAHLDQAFSEAQAKDSPRAASWPLQRREHLAKLTRVIRAEDFLLPQTAVVRLEDEFAGSWRGFTVTGYVDRVDSGPGGLVLTDYKTGKSMPLGAKNSRGEPKLDLQLPLYVETAAPAWYGDEAEVRSARYFSLNGAATIGEAKVDEQELQSFVERVMTILERGDFPVDPDAEQKVCAYCDFDPVCRRGPRLGRKRQRAEREPAPGATP